MGTVCRKHEEFRIRPGDLARFWSRVDKGPNDEGYFAKGCWLWTGRKMVQGYGLFWFGTRERTAHGVAWEFAHGCPLPAGMFALHTCDEGANGCVRSEHVYPGTQLQNIRDRVTRDRDGGTRIAWNGQSRTLSAWARHLGISRATLQTRFRLGWVIDKAFGRPPRAKRGINTHG